MSWITDDAGDLFNLDHVISIVMHEVESEQPDPEKSYCLIAAFPHQDSIWIFSGTEEACKTQRLKLQGKLPMVKL